MSLSRLLLQRMILIMGILTALEVMLVISVPFVVPDIGARLSRLTNQALLPAPPAVQGDPAVQYSRPLFIDEDFSSVSPIWDQSLALVENDQLAIDVLLPNSDVYALWSGPRDDATVSSRVQDFDVRATMTQTRGSNEAGYGWRFRQDTTDSYIMVMLNSRGYWRIQRSIDDTVNDLTPWQFSRHINQGIDVPNELHVRAQGSLIQVWINGVAMGEVTDFAPVAGQLTLAVSTMTDGDVQITFDDVTGTIGDYRLNETFSDATTASFSQGGSYSRNGVYHMIASPGISMWQNPLPRAQTEVTDFQMSVEAVITQGNPDQMAYGLLFGDTGNFDYTMVLISGNGVLQVVQTTNSGNSDVLIEPIQLDVLNQGANVRNTLAIEVQQNRMTIGANGTLLGTVTLPQPIRGSVGMVIVSGNQLSEVQFDNFTLNEIQQ
ncbi:MAG: hypothetical protein FJ040_12425 [Chloroflexi bacterium]|nr:hypothetical protein [Chloroflexota bacterium]